MKRSVGLLSIIAAAVMAAPAAMAGDILKCVDAGGHVTLTDQPCPTGAAAIRLAQDGDSDNAPVVQRHVLTPTELRRQTWARPAVTPAAVATPVRLAGDVATLKAAHRTLLMLDAKPRLAGLN